MSQAAAPQSASPAKLIADRILHGESVAIDVLRIAAANILLILSAHIAIPLPFTPVPVTGQTFGVLLVAVLLGSRRGMLTCVLYLLEGMAGLPVFSAAWRARAAPARRTHRGLFARLSDGCLCHWLARRTHYCSWLFAFCNCSANRRPHFRRSDHSCRWMRVAGPRNETRLEWRNLRGSASVHTGRNY
jgi:hypothetical protein